MQQHSDQFFDQQQPNIQPIQQQQQQSHEEQQIIAAEQFIQNMIEKQPNTQEQIEQLENILDNEDLLNQNVKKFLDQIKSNFEKKKFPQVLKDLKSILNHVRSFNVEKYYDLKSKSQQEALKTQDKDLILFIGETGSGKSTTIAFLAGEKMIETRRVGQSSNIVPQEPFINNDLRNIIISPDYKSATSYITTVSLAEKKIDSFDLENYLFCDSPGQGDTRGVEIEVANSQAIFEVFKVCKSLRVVVVLSQKNTGDRGQHFKQYLEDIHLTFQNYTEEINDSFFYIFTKFQESESLEIYLENVIDGLQESQSDQTIIDQLEYIKNGLDKDYSIKIDPLQDNPEEILRKIFNRKSIKLELQADKIINGKARLQLQEYIKILEKTLIKAINQRNYKLIDYRVNQLNKLKDNIEINTISDTKKNVENHISKEIKIQKLQRDSIITNFDYLYSKISFNIIDDYKNLKIFTIGMENINKFLQIKGITDGITMDYLDLQINKKINLNIDRLTLEQIQDDQIKVFLSNIQLVCEQSQQEEFYLNIQNKLVKLIQESYKNMNCLIQQQEYLQFGIQLNIQTQNIDELKKQFGDLNLQKGFVEVISNFFMILNNLKNNIQEILQQTENIDFEQLTKYCSEIQQIYSDKNIIECINQYGNEQLWKQIYEDIKKEFQNKSTNLLQIIEQKVQNINLNNLESLDSDYQILEKIKKIFIILDQSLLQEYDTVKTYISIKIQNLNDYAQGILNNLRNKTFKDKLNEEDVVQLQIFQKPDILEKFTDGIKQKDIFNNLQQAIDKYFEDYQETIKNLSEDIYDYKQELLGYEIIKQIDNIENLQYFYSKTTKLREDLKLQYKNKMQEVFIRFIQENLLTEKQQLKNLEFKIDKVKDCVTFLEKCEQVKIDINQQNIHNYCDEYKAHILNISSQKFDKTKQKQSSDVKCKQFAELLKINIEQFDQITKTSMVNKLIKVEDIQQNWMEQIQELYEVIYKDLKEGNSDSIKINLSIACAFTKLDYLLNDQYKFYKLIEKFNDQIDNEDKLYLEEQLENFQYSNFLDHYSKMKSKINEKQSDVLRLLMIKHFQMLSDEINSHLQKKDFEKIHQYLTKFSNFKSLVIDSSLDPNQLIDQIQEFLDKIQVEFTQILKIKKELAFNLIKSFEFKKIDKERKEIIQIISQFQETFEQLDIKVQLDSNDVDQYENEYIQNTFDEFKNPNQELHIKLTPKLIYEKISDAKEIDIKYEEYLKDMDEIFQIRIKKEIGLIINEQNIQNQKKQKALLENKYRNQLPPHLDNYLTTEIDKISLNIQQFEQDEDMKLNNIIQQCEKKLMHGQLQLLAQQYEEWQNIGFSKSIEIINIMSLNSNELRNLISSEISDMDVKDNVDEILNYFKELQEIHIYFKFNKIVEQNYLQILGCIYNKLQECFKILIQIDTNNNINQLGNVFYILNKFIELNELEHKQIQQIQDSIMGFIESIYNKFNNLNDLIDSKKILEANNFQEFKKTLQQLMEIESLQKIIEEQENQNKLDKFPKLKQIIPPQKKLYSEIRQEISKFLQKLKNNIEKIDDFYFTNNEQLDEVTYYVNIDIYLNIQQYLNNSNGNQIIDTEVVSHFVKLVNLKNNILIILDQKEKFDFEQLRQYCMEAQKIQSNKNLIQFIKEFEQQHKQIFEVIKNHFGQVLTKLQKSIQQTLQTLNQENFNIFYENYQTIKQIVDIYKIMDQSSQFDQQCILIENNIQDKIKELTQKAQCLIQKLQKKNINEQFNEDLEQLKVLGNNNLIEIFITDFKQKDIYNQLKSAFQNYFKELVLEIQNQTEDISQYQEQLLGYNKISSLKQNENLSKIYNQEIHNVENLYKVKILKIANQIKQYIGSNKQQTEVLVTKEFPIKQVQNYLIFYNNCIKQNYQKEEIQKFQQILCDYVICYQKYWQEYIEKQLGDFQKVNQLDFQSFVSKLIQQFGEFDNIFNIDIVDKIVNVQVIQKHWKQKLQNLWNFLKNQLENKIDKQKYLEMTQSLTNIDRFMIDESKFQKLFQEFNDRIDSQDNKILDQFLQRFQYKEFMDYYLNIKSKLNEIQLNILQNMIHNHFQWLQVEINNNLLKKDQEKFQEQLQNFTKFQSLIMLNQIEFKQIINKIQKLFDDIKIKFQKTLHDNIREVKHLLNAYKFQEFTDRKNIILKITQYYFEIFNEQFPFEDLEQHKDQFMIKIFNNFKNLKQEISTEYTPKIVHDEISKIQNNDEMQKYLHDLNESLKTRIDLQINQIQIELNITKQKENMNILKNKYQNSLPLQNLKYLNDQIGQVLNKISWEEQKEQISIQTNLKQFQQKILRIKEIHHEYEQYFIRGFNVYQYHNEIAEQCGKLQLEIKKVDEKDNIDEIINYYKELKEIHFYFHFIRSVDYNYNQSQVFIDNKLQEYQKILIQIAKNNNLNQIGRVFQKLIILIELIELEHKQIQQIQDSIIGFIESIYIKFNSLNDQIGNKKILEANNFQEFKKTLKQLMEIESLQKIIEEQENKNKLDKFPKLKQIIPPQKKLYSEIRQEIFDFQDKFKQEIDNFKLTDKQQKERDDYYKTIENQMKIAKLYQSLVEFDKQFSKELSAGLQKKIQQRFQEETIILKQNFESYKLLDVEKTKICYNNLQSLDKYQILDPNQIISDNIMKIDQILFKQCDSLKEKFKGFIQKKDVDQITVILKESDQLRINFPNIQKIKSHVDSLIQLIREQYRGNQLYKLLTYFERQNLGQYILGHSVFEGLKFLKFNRGIKDYTIEQAINDLQGDSLEKENIKKFYDQFNQIYITELKNYLSQIRLSDEEKFIEKIIEKIKDLSNKSGIFEGVKQFFNKSDKKETNIPELTAFIALLWTIKNIKYYKTMDNLQNQQDRDLFLLKPHAGQIIAIFRMLGLGYQQENGIVNNLVQVSTGEGKSLILAITSIILALTNCQVYCACYSKQLSERDYTNFRSIFEQLGLQNKIHYGTFNKLCEQIINQKGDIRDKIQQITLNDNKFYKDQTQDLPIILLIDEVDVFFNKDFYGNVYTPITKVKHNLINKLTNYIWENRDKRINFNEIKQSNEYQNICKEIKNIVFIIDEAIKNMVYDLSNYMHDYIVKDDKIQYKLQDSISSNIVVGYKTMFAYYREKEKKNITPKSLNESISINLYSSNFSYAEIPKIFKNIIGVTGTLKTLSDFEKKIITEDYNIKLNTYIHSIYTNKLKDEDWKNDIEIEKNKNEYELNIINDILEKQKDTAILVFFENREKLQKFRELEQFKDIKHQYLTELSNTNEINQVVESATYLQQVTLLTKDYGRGTDFKCDDEVVNKQGVYVIQTFFSENKSEEIQIKGRTARQGQKGKYKITLYEPDLEKFFGFGDGYSSQIDQIRNMEKHKRYDELDKLRLKFFDKQNIEQRDHCKKLVDEHHKSIQFRDILQNLNQKKSLQQAKQFLLERNLGPEKICSRTIFLMDATGSMSSLLSKVKNQISQIIYGVHEIVNNFKKLKNMNFESQFEIQFVIYRDYDCLKDQIIQYSSWEFYPNPLESFIKDIKAEGGQDYEEAIEIALLHVNQEHVKQPISQVILIGDAPAKSIESIKQYRSIYGVGGEDYWNKSGIPLTDYKEQLIKLNSNNIPVHSFYLNSGCQKNFQEISDETKGQCKNMDLTDEGKCALQHRVSEQILQDLEKLNNIQGDVLVNAYRQKMGFTLDK